MKINARIAITSLVSSMALAGCISLESPSGQGPQWAARMKANSAARKAQQGMTASGGAAAPGDPASLPPGAVAAGGDAAYSPQPVAQSSGGSGFFGVLNGGDAPGIPQRPKYDQVSRREPIREGQTNWLRQETAPMEAVAIDKKTGYPVRNLTPPSDPLPLPQQGQMVGAQFPEPPATPAPAAPVPIDPKDIKTGTRGSTFGRVRSPYPPYLELDSGGVLPGSLARDPATGKVFRIP